MARPALAVGLVVLVVLGGCSALEPGVDRTPYDVPPPTPSPTPTVTATPTPTATVVSGARIPGPAEQRRWLSLLPNYTVEFSRTITIDDTELLVTNLTCRIDARNERGRCRSWFGQEGSTDPAVTVTYRGEGVLQSKRTGGETDGATVTAGDQRPRREVVAVLEEWLGRLDGVALERNGTVTFEGEVTTRYTGIGPEAVPENGDRSAYRAVVLVDDWRSIRYAAVEAVDDLGTRTEWFVAVTDVGATTVTRPEWVAEETGNASRKN
jgi:hypothetical protein